MREFKMENYRREHPSMPPPQFVSLTDHEASRVVAPLLTDADGHVVAATERFRWFADHATPIEGVNLEDVELDLRHVFHRCGVRPDRFVYLEWGALQEIDRFETDELAKHFYDIWYPGADDVELFDDSGMWLMFIRHYGAVQIWRRELNG